MFEQYIEAIQANGGIPTGEILQKLIKEHETIKNELTAKYERYKASEKGVPIFDRKLSQNEAANKINNKLNNDFAGEIVDTKVGYFAGIPISYTYEDGDLPQIITDFNRLSDIEDLDAETAKQQAIFGYGTRLMYLGTDGEERVKKVNPANCILIFEDSMTQPVYAVRYFTVKDIEGKENTKAEFYNESAVVFFRNADDTFAEENVLDHKFGACPLFGIPNNDESQGDFDKVTSLIDAYDRAFSDVNSEIEQLRLAYMVVRGMITGSNEKEQIEFLDKLQRTGLIEIDDEGEVKFITKDLNDAVIEHHLDRLNERIKNGAKTVDFSDEAFGGNLSGVSLKYKLFGLETKCMYSELKMKKALRYQYRLLANSRSVRGDSFEADKVKFTFTRNVFVDYKAEADTLSALKGMVSDETAYSLMSFIKDPMKELDKLQQERDQQVTVNLDTVPAG